MAVTLVVEDGTGKANANVLMDLCDVRQYLAGHPHESNFDDLTGEEPALSLIAATNYLDTRFRYYGQTLTTTQALQWPRTKNYDHHGAIIPAGTIPDQLKKACASLCGWWAKNKGLLFATDPTGPVKQVQDEGMSITFESTGVLQNMLIGSRYPDVELLIHSIGELKDSTWMSETKSTETRY